MTSKTAHAVYTLLVSLGGASENDRPSFVQYYTENVNLPSEWRFMGTLGLGGKFYMDEFSWRVGCYREDDTPARISTITTLNQVLADLRLAPDTVTDPEASR
jgi:hypothetical protein